MQQNPLAAVLITNVHVFVEKGGIVHINYTESLIDLQFLDILYCPFSKEEKRMRGWLVIWWGKKCWLQYCQQYHIAIVYSLQYIDIYMRAIQ